MTNELSWVACDGGPLLLLPKVLEKVWQGSFPVEGNRLVEAKFRWSAEPSAPATDYDLACDVDDSVGVIEVAGTQALVFATEDSMGTWLPSDEFQGGLLVALRFGPKASDPAAALHAAVSRVPRDSFQDTGLSLEIASDEGLLICAACDAGPNWLYKPQLVSMSSGKYSVYTADVEIDGFSLWLHGLSLV